MIKKIYLKVFLLWFIVFFGFSFGFADLGGFEIENYNVNVKLQEDGTAKIQEDLNINFFQPRHGIFRNVKKQYSVENTLFQIFVSKPRVDKYKYSISDWYDSYSFKIWSPDFTVEWKQIYSLWYDVYGGIRKFSWYQELYWNLIWSERDTQIKNVDFVVEFPFLYTGITKDDVFVYYGLYWTKNTTNANYVFSKTWVYGTIIWWLWQNESVTIGIKFPADFFTLDDSKQESLLVYNYYSDYKYIPTFGGIDVPIKNKFSLILFAIVFFSYGLVFLRIALRNYTKNIRKKQVLIAHYYPPEWLSASEVWVLADDSADAHDITAMIYVWASKWYVKIQQEKDEKSFWWAYKYFIVKLKELPENTVEYEKYLFDKLFADWKDKFSFSNQSTFTNYVKTSLWKLENYLLWKWFYTIKSFQNKYQKVMWNWVIYVVFWWVVTAIIFVASSETLSDQYEISFSDRFIFLVFWINILSFIWMFFLPKQEILTENWVKLRSEILWFKMFLNKVETDRLKTFLEQDPLYFDKVLPFAIVLGLQSKFIKTITPLLKDLPDWYDWNRDWFSRSLISTIGVINTASRYVPPSSYGVSYSSSSWFSSGSSFSSGGWWGFSWWWWGGGWGGSW